MGDEIKSITVKGKTTVVTRLFQVSDALLYADAGSQVTLQIVRDGQEQTVTVTVRINVKVLETHDKWFGVTYAEDKEYVQNAFKQLIEDGVYPEKLWK